MLKGMEIHRNEWGQVPGGHFQAFPHFRAFRFVSIALIMTLLAWGSSCGRETARPPIPEDKLIGALIDVHFAEAAVQSLRGATKDSVINLYYDQICEIHGLNREEFETTMEIYRNDPIRMEKLYTKVMAEMERQEVKQEKKGEEE